jgi:hypothetical protein
MISRNLPSNTLAIMDLPSKLAIIGSTMHPRYGEGKIIQSEKGLILEKAVSTNSASKIKTLYKHLHKNVIRTYRYKAKEEEYFNCGIKGDMINAYFEFLPNTLLMLIDLSI